MRCTGACLCIGRCLASQPGSRKLLCRIWSAARRAAQLRQQHATQTSHRNPPPAAKAAHEARPAGSRCAAPGWCKGTLGAHGSRRPRAPADCTARGRLQCRPCCMPKSPCRRLVRIWARRQARLGGRCKLRCAPAPEQGVRLIWASRAGARARSTARCRRFVRCARWACLLARCPREAGVGVTV